MNELRVAVPAWTLKRRIEVDYLMVGDLLPKEISNVVQLAPEDEFYDLIAKHMNAYLKDGRMPPADIAASILNLVDDQAAGRKLTLRAGDYISLQNHLRAEMGKGKT